MESAQPWRYGSDPTGLHRVLEPAGVLPQAAVRLDTSTPLWADEVEVAVTRLNLDAASYRQLWTKHAGDGAAIRAEVIDIVRARGKMHNPVTGSGGMLTGEVTAVGPQSRLRLAVGDSITTLVSLTLTPLVITDALTAWDGSSEQVPCEGRAILFGRSIVAVLPHDLPAHLALAVMDVCGAPALTARVVQQYVDAGRSATVCVVGGAGKSGSMSLAAAKDCGATTVAVVPVERERELVERFGLADQVVVADARDPVALSSAVVSAGGPADITVVCVDVPGCEGGAILSTAQGGTVIFFSMATSFSAAALGAEGLASDVTMLIGNGYVPGHADLALQLMRTHAGVRALFEQRLEHEAAR
ncbi:MAG: L-erythro-3,5-diaminohexanoate dehydrogenase [Nocardioidaceae bacterium]